MRKNVILIVVVLFSVGLFVPVKQTENKEGVVLFNSDQTVIFFIPLDDLNFDVCTGEISKFGNLKGIQVFRTLENYRQFYQPSCRIITSDPGEDYNLSIRTWYIGKCAASFAFRQSVINSFLSSFRYEKLSLEANNKVFINFKYLKGLEVFDLQLKEIT